MIHLCTNCNHPLPEYSIEWSNLPDNKKCKCKNPGYPSPPIHQIFKAFVNLFAGGK